MSFDGEKLVGARVCVIGAGVSGRAAARLLYRKGAMVTVADVNVVPHPGEGFPPDIDWRTGDQREALARDYDLAVISPGVPLAVPDVAAMAARGIPIIGEIELASRYFEGPLLGVTGTNGKSTTVEILGAMLKAGGRKPFVGGNLGNPLCDALLEDATFDCAVVELSSFQLETVQTLHLAVAVLLNMKPDHLDRYEGVNDYHRAKARIFERQTASDYAVFNAGDAIVAACAAKSAAVKCPVGTAVNSAPGVNITDDGFTLLEAGGTRMTRVTNPALAAPHNVFNAACAAMAARLFGVRTEAIEKALANFSGLDHRFQFVEEIDGVRFIDDSKATNVAAAATALRSADAPCHLIVGGLAKESDLSELKSAATAKVKKVYAIGKAAPMFTGAFSGAFETVESGTLERAVEDAFAAAKPGEIVLLAPACASFDQFRNYMERGDLFKRYVRQLAARGKTELSG